MFTPAVSMLLLFIIIAGAFAENGPGYSDPKYVPAPSVGHEIGIMFAFIGAMLVSMLIYTLIWQIGNRRNAQREKERVETMRKSGYLDARRGADEVKEKSEGTEIRE